ARSAERSERGRQQEHAGADHVADDECRRTPEAERPRRGHAARRTAFDAALRHAVPRLAHVRSVAHPRPPLASARDVGAFFDEQLSQHRAVAVRLVLAIAADREIRRVRERREHIEQVIALGTLHFGAIFTYELLPLGGGRRVQRKLHDFRAWREIRQPHVVPVLRGVTRLRHAARRAPYRADTHTFVARARTAEPDDTDAHFSFRGEAAGRSHVTRLLTAKIAPNAYRYHAHTSARKLEK